MVDHRADYTFKILLLGDAAVGKTALVNRFVHEKFQKEYLLTIGFEPYSKYESINNTQLCYTIFDIAGSQQFTKLRSRFYKGARGSLVVFDLTRKNTFDNVVKWIDDAKKHAPDQLFILVGNKNDLKKQREVKKSEAKKKAKEIGSIRYIETSALTGEHVNEAFNELGEKILAMEK